MCRSTQSLILLALAGCLLATWLHGAAACDTPRAQPDSAEPEFDEVVPLCGDAGPDDTAGLTSDELLSSGKLDQLYNAGFRLTHRKDPACIDLLLTASALGSRDAVHLLPECLSVIDDDDEFRSRSRDIAMILGGYKCNSIAVNQLVLEADRSKRKYLRIEAAFLGTLQHDLYRRAGAGVSKKLLDLVEEFHAELNERERRLFDDRLRKESVMFVMCIQKPDMFDYRVE